MISMGCPMITTCFFCNPMNHPYMPAAMRKLSASLFLPVFLLMVVSHIRAQTIQLTNGGSTSVSGATDAVPVSSYFEYMRFQVVYTAAELNAAGITGPKTISQLGWYIVTAPANALPNYTIRLANTTATNSATHNTSALTEVYSSASYAPVAGGFDMLTLSSGFVWNGTDNILVDVCYGAAAYTAPYGTIRNYAVTTTNGSRRVRCDACGSQCSNTNNTTNTFKPQIALTFTAPPPPCLSGPTSPGNAQTTCPGATQTLTWAAVSGATSYDVYFGTASTPPFVANTSATSYVATTPATGTYYWQIRPKSSAGTASGCPVWSFTATPTDASFAYAKNSYCQAGADPTPTIYGVSGGMFSAPPQVSIAPSTGTIDVSASTVGGPYTITYNTGGACPAGSTFSLSIVNCMPGATLTDALVIDNGAAGKADPGDRIRLTAKISNSQAADYTGVQLTLNNDPRVTFVTNTFKSTPIAVDDAYQATKNMQLVVAVGSGVLINDFDNAALNVNASSSSSAQGGSVVINANGSFTYTPPNGFTGNDTFTYTITDADAQTDMATVRIRVQ